MPRATVIHSNRRPRRMLQNGGSEGDQAKLACRPGLQTAAGKNHRMQRHGRISVFGSNAQCQTLSRAPKALEGCGRPAAGLEPSVETGSPVWFASYAKISMGRLVAQGCLHRRNRGPLSAYQGTTDFEQWAMCFAGHPTSAGRSRHLPTGDGLAVCTACTQLSAGEQTLTLLDALPWPVEIEEGLSGLSNWPVSESALLKGLQEPLPIR